MKVEFITNACFLVTLSNGKKILTDPWFAGPCYYGSWYNFPPVENKKRYFDCKPDYIYISHIHPDHFHPKTLSHFDKSIPIIIAQFPHSHLVSKIRMCGFTNIREHEVKQMHSFEGGEIIFFPDFCGFSFAEDDGVNYAMDTSFLITDSDGTTLLNVNDNPIQARDAKEIREKYGSPTISIIPNSGASLYPHAFFNYTEEQKKEKCIELTQRMLSKFLGVAAELGSKYLIPAAGSYVMGGKIWEYSKYLHQPTPTQTLEAYNKAGLESKLLLMCEGDIFCSSENFFKKNEKNKWRKFTCEERLAYAESLKSNLLSHEEIFIPEDFIQINWLSLILRARHNLWGMQNRLDNFPQWDVTIEAYGKSSIKIEFPFNENRVYKENDTKINSKKIVFKLDSELFKMTMLQSAHWNNVQVAALVQVSREPDEFDPSVFTLMSFFHP